MSSDLIRKGQKSDHVKSLQQKLVQLGWDLNPDGIFGDKTDAAVRELQTLFGYTVDGLVGEGTTRLIDAQIGYGWNYKAPDAKQKALAAQGKAVEGKPVTPSTGGVGTKNANAPAQPPTGKEPSTAQPGKAPAKK